LRASHDIGRAAHLLAELGDPQAIPELVPLLKDPDINYKVAWALGEIGDRRAVGPLLDALDDGSPSIRVPAIRALETLRAKEALPHLIPLLSDNRKPDGGGVSVAEAARAAIENLQ
jgi:HEAT repeat protein